MKISLNLNYYLMDYKYNLYTKLNRIEINLDGNDKK